MSGNPGGRPKGFGALIREATNNGQEMVDFACKVLRGEDIRSAQKKADQASRGEDNPEFADPRTRMDANKWLAAYSVGQPPQAPAEDETKKLTDEELEAQVAAMMRERKANHRGTEVVQ